MHKLHCLVANNTLITTIDSIDNPELDILPLLLTTLYEVILPIPYAPSHPSSLPVLPSTLLDPLPDLELFLAALELKATSLLPLLPPPPLHPSNDEDFIVGATVGVAEILLLYPSPFQDDASYSTGDFVGDTVGTGVSSSWPSLPHPASSNLGMLMLMDMLMDILIDMVDCTGETVGDSVGDSVTGEAVGDSVGDSVTGEAVGDSVGASVTGEAVGASVSSSSTSYPSPFQDASSTGDFVGDTVGTGVSSSYPSLPHPGSSTSSSGMLMDILIDMVIVGMCEGTKVGSFVRGEIVGEPSGRAGQKVGQALDISDCSWLFDGVIVGQVIFPTELCSYSFNREALYLRNRTTKWWNEN
jgi:hypothetical protein